MAATEVTLYKLEINGDIVCEVTVEVPAWLPVKPRIDPRVLRPMVASAIRNYFSRRQSSPKSEVVKA